MLLSWRRFDALLRGQLSPAERVRLPLTWLTWQVVCAGLFGASLGVFALTSRALPDPRYLLAGAVKVPLLLVFTSGITIPSLYVFGALRGLRFSAREFAAHLMVAHTVLAAVLGSLAPVVAFFALTTSSYSFMVLLVVITSTIAGMLGVKAFVRALNEPAEVRALATVGSDASWGGGEPPRNAPPVAEERALAVAPGASLPALSPEPSLLALAAGVAPSSPSSAGTAPIEVPDTATRLVDEAAVVARRAALPVPAGVDPGAWRLLGWWLVLYMFVGTQAGWILRPFIGRPELGFVLLRGKEGGFFGGVLYHLGRFFFGDG